MTIPDIVRNQWTRNGISFPSCFSNDVTITEVLIQNGSFQYEAMFYFNLLDNINNSGEYSCHLMNYL